MQEVVELIKTITGDESSFIAQLPKEVKRDVCRHISMTTLCAKDILFRQGDKGDAFYMILTGKVGVFITSYDGL